MQYLKGISLLEANVGVQLYFCTCLCPSAFLDVTEALVSRLTRVQCQELQVLFLVRSPDQWIKLFSRPIELQWARLACVLLSAEWLLLIC